MACLTGQLTIDLCCEMVVGFYFGGFVGLGWVGAYFVDWFAKHFTE